MKLQYSVPASVCSMGSSIGINILSILSASLFKPTTRKACINWSQVALLSVVNQKWNISLQHSFASSLLALIVYNFCSNFGSSNSRPRSCHLQEQSSRTCLFKNLRAGGSQPVTKIMIIIIISRLHQYSDTTNIRTPLIWRSSILLKPVPFHHKTFKFCNSPLRGIAKTRSMSWYLKNQKHTCIGIAATENTNR